MTTDSIASLNLSDYDRTMEANARSAVAGIKHAVHVMILHRSGCIICTASTAGVLGGVNPAYCISKAAVIGAVRTLARELGRHGVRVNAISPHAIGTPFGLRGLAELIPGASEEELRRMVERGAMNEMGGGTVLEVENIARAAVYLASVRVQVRERAQPRRRRRVHLGEADSHAGPSEELVSSDMHGYGAALFSINQLLSSIPRVICCSTSMAPWSPPVA